MSYRLTWMFLLVVVVGSALAQICTPEWGYEGYSYIINNQSDLDEIAAKCATINGSIAMSYNYTGAFHLPNIRNITKGFKWFTILAVSMDDPKPTSINLPDLEFLGGSIWFNSLPTLKSFTAPKLKTVGSKALIDVTQELDLRSLVESEYLSVRGDATSVRLDSLRQVREQIQICNSDECNSNNSSHGTLDLSLPALHDVGHLLLQGRFSSLDTPKLTNISGFGSGSYSILLRSEEGPEIDLSFPELKYIQDDSLWLEGSIGSLSMPSLTNLTAWLYVKTYHRLDINLPFEEAGTMTLAGNISSVQLPNLKSVGQLQVNTDVSLDCKSLEETIIKATNASRSPVACHVENSAWHLGINLGAKVAFGSVVGVVVGLVMSY
ncbi:hypothetical protein AO1008_00578 [Aspergillus oryzae 100-8]|uniref:Uncharacterized protein n=1 Tax=Aspergillus oryzae (strain 3.042) TaxID=1160506 RepID=I8IQE2_ASPO3|nr:hypothetical protein Ao3042_01925 [Aspergillus oryzae 3.042]KDE85235.1 hypothetical protein AO1008_00578 [Aspergillus oryzae 100-8]|eukprot:EIT81586.1 hypothetical protein Ao3042_01925 [Aspergillus oryzae 3.042]